MKKIFSSKEFQYILISTLVLGFCFSFRWKGSFSLNGWASAFLSAMIIVGLALTGKLIFQKYIAEKFECKVTYDLWLSGLGLAALTTAGTLGWLIWAAPGAIKILPKHRFRIGKKREKVHPGPYEYGIIALSGILVFFGLAILGKIFLSVGYSIFGHTLLYVGSYLAIFHLIPFVYPHNTVPPAISKGNLPNLDGVWLLFGSRPLWAFSFSFILVSVLGFFFLSLFTSLILATVGSVLLYIIWQYYVEPWSYASPTKRGFKSTKSKKNFKIGK